MIAAKSVRTKVEYRDVLKKIEELIADNPKKEIPSYDELDMLGALASAYEDIHYPIEFKQLSKY